MLRRLTAFLQPEENLTLDAIAVFQIFIRARCTCHLRNQHYLTIFISKPGIRNRMPIQHFLQAVLPKLQLHLLGLVFFNMEVIPLAKNISVWQTISCQNPVIPRHNIQLKLSVFPFASAEIKSQIALSICHRNGPVLVVIPVLILPGQNSKVSFLAALFQHRNELYAIPVLNGTICRIQPGRNSKGSCNGNKQYFMGFLPCNLKVKSCCRRSIGSKTLLVISY